MKCQVMSVSSSLEVSFTSLSTSFKGAAVLSESIIFTIGIRGFRVWIPRDDVLVGDWIQLWMVEQVGRRLVCKIREDYFDFLDVLRGQSSPEVKLLRLRCLVELNKDFKVRKGF